MFCVAIRLEVKRIVSTFFLIHAHHESEKKKKKKKSPNTGFGGFPSFLTLSNTHIYIDAPRLLAYRKSRNHDKCGQYYKVWTLFTRLRDTA